MSRNAMRRTGSSSPASGTAPRRPHTPRSHVFSGLPPPAIHTVNLQRCLDESKAQVADLTQTVVLLEEELRCLKEKADCADTLPAEPTDMTKATMFREQADFLTGLSKTAGKSRITPDRYNATLALYCDDLQRKLLQQSTEIINLSTELAKLKHARDRIGSDPPQSSLDSPHRASTVASEGSPQSAVMVSSAVIVSAASDVSERTRTRLPKGVGAAAKDKEAAVRKERVASFTPSVPESRAIPQDVVEKVRGSVGEGACLCT
eukprot:TRINITY_DN3590_c0_g1_i2.p1 TRINITY_DN3590_c0_g1~~TRINITY_DN3590_c0_g1_i2.p1  ORF type:complete len:262 (+),score=68.71 TRINITY_DN3590_c0_g1_i2:77-862(+)